MQNIKLINKKELAEKGQAIYEKIKAKLEPEYIGKTVVIEVDTGDYAIGNSIISASDELRKKHPNKVFYAVKVGRRAYYKHYW